MQKSFETMTFSSCTEAAWASRKRKEDFSNSETYEPGGCKSIGYYNYSSWINSITVLTKSLRQQARLNKTVVNSHALNAGRWYTKSKQVPAIYIALTSTCDRCRPGSPCRWARRRSAPSVWGWEASAGRTGASPPWCYTPGMSSADTSSPYRNPLHPCISGRADFSRCRQPAATQWRVAECCCRHILARWWSPSPRASHGCYASAS